MEWNDRKSWLMDILKSVVLFIVFAVLTYFVIDKINDKKNRETSKWEQRLSLEVDVIRDFEISYRHFIVNAYNVYSVLLLDDKEPASYKKVEDFDSSYRDLIVCTNSLVFWFENDQLELSQDISSFKDRLLSIKEIEDVSPDSEVIDARETYRQENEVEYFKYWLDDYLNDNGINVLDNNVPATDSTFNEILFKIKRYRDI